MRYTILKLAALLFPLALVCQPAHALKCLGYVEFHGKWACAAYAVTSPCESSDQRCIPVNPPRPPTISVDPGGAQPGPSPGGVNDRLAPDEMSCSQLTRQIRAQQAIINLLNADMVKASRDLALAEAALAGAWAESAVDAALAEKTTACDAWNNMLMVEPDMMVCTEPRGNKPPKCKLRRLTSAEQTVKNSCDAKSRTEAILRISRNGALQVKTINAAVIFAAQRKKELAQSNLKQLSDALNGKPDCP